MRFGGHETFPIREDWLPKGLQLVARDPVAFADRLVCDKLAVGRNMAKSIRYWLLSTGLIRRQQDANGLELTPIGKLVLEYDEYMVRTGTWWALHANLVCSIKDAAVWHLFFGHLSRDWFDRNNCNAELSRLLESDPRPPTEKTLARDVACLLSSYATPVPAVACSVEDGQECPFRSLNIMRHMLSSDSYRVDRTRKNIPPEVVGYVLSLQEDATEQYFHVALSGALASPKGPGRVLVLDTDGLVELVGVAEEEYGNEYVQTSIEGGERFVRVRNLGQVGWLEQYYHRRVGHVSI